MKLSNIHERIADDVCAESEYWLTCQCGEERKISTQQFADYLRHGWPTHCGSTMALQSRKAVA